MFQKIVVLCVLLLSITTKTVFASEIKFPQKKMLGEKVFAQSASGAWEETSNSYIETTDLETFVLQIEMSKQTGDSLIERIEKILLKIEKLGTAGTFNRAISENGTLLQGYFQSETSFDRFEVNKKQGHFLSVLNNEESVMISSLKSHGDIFLWRVEIQTKKLSKEENVFTVIDNLQKLNWDAAELNTDILYKRGTESIKIYANPEFFFDIIDDTNELLDPMVRLFFGPLHDIFY